MIRVNFRVGFMSRTRVADINASTLGRRAAQLPPLPRVAPGDQVRASKKLWYYLHGRLTFLYQPTPPGLLQRASPHLESVSDTALLITLTWQYRHVFFAL